MSESTWREGTAAALDHCIADIDKYLAEADNAEAMALDQGDEKLAAETRALASAWRAKRADLVAHARDLRSAAEPWSVLPISVTTTRHLREVDR